MPGVWQGGIGSSVVRTDQTTRKRRQSKDETGGKRGTEGNEVRENVIHTTEDIAVNPERKA